MAELLPLLLGMPIAAAGLCLTLPSLPARRAVLWLVSLAVLAYGTWGLSVTADGSVVAHQVSGWAPGVAIPFALDTLSALLITATSFLVLVCSLYAAAAREDTDRYFASLVLVMSGGVYGAFATADLFNLFVMVEVALVPSYVLMTRTASRPSLRAAGVYVTVNLFISTTLLFGIALVYGATGTVNLGELAGAAERSSTAAAALAVVLVALAGKAAMVPLHGWLPRSYPHLSTSLSAMFSGLLTKIGVYALFRVYAVTFGADERLEGIIQAILVIGMVVGVLGALGSSDMRAILSFHMSSQVGYILLGLGIFGVAGLAASIFYLIQYMMAKAALFLAVGVVQRESGSGDLRDVGGMARRSPLLAAAFLVPALSLAGIPPLSGFVAKFLLVVAAVDVAAFLAAAAVVAVSLFTLLSMLKIWNGAFWGDPPAGAATARIPHRLVLPAVALASLTVVLGVGGEGLIALSTTAAGNLVDLGPYIEAVRTP
ncbi:monovalent cation/H+ antiporter subunit D family protein [Microbacterium aurum]|uniref:monovalent cation/H+ antiporter subunit D family protein n=1 Tax=Microbacterium aurum TaxID=36805 RepID=UPI0028EC4E49|nr:monovalent cation/H+ antiporter subunit D family protein [Microbacterium aurum]